MNKLYAVLYAIILLFALFARTIECFAEALLESRGISFSFFLETFRYNWNDQRYYTPISQHIEIIKDYWNETE